MPRASTGGLLAGRFWPRVAFGDGCWNWTGKRNGGGYGVVNVEGKTPLAHRVAWSLVNGPVPEGQRVLHRCDNPSCVRPDHLFLGTQADNLADMRQKGRAKPGPGAKADQAAINRPRGDDHWSRRNPELVRRGERHHKAKMTAEQVIELRRLSSEGWSLARLAERFGIRISTASYIVRRETWRDIP